MSRADPTANSPAIPWGLLGTLALIVVTEGVVVRQDLDFSDPVSLCWRLADRSAREAAPGRALLLAGDSLVKHGLVPRVIAARSGRTAVNLAVARGPAPATFFLVRRALDAGARPVALVVDFKPNVLAGGPRHISRYWPEILTLREILDLALVTRSPRFLGDLVLGRLLPSFRSRHEIRGHLQATLRGEADRLHSINRMCLRNWTVNDGANVAARNPAFHGAVGPETDSKYQTRHFQCHPVNALFVHRLFALAAARGVPVYWLLPPLAPELQARRDQAGSDADFLQFVRSMQAGAAGVTVLDARHSGYDHTLFVDATHLDGQGAQALSRAVADVLRHDLECAGPTAAPGPARWVDLPAYRTAPVEIVLEDIEQSRRFVSRTR
jgi:hypothetical protein